MIKEPAKPGDGIKPGVERSGTPGSLVAKSKSPRSGGKGFTISKSVYALSHASRAPISLCSLSWDFASLHPRLNASTRYAGFGKSVSIIFRRLVNR